MKILPVINLSNNYHLEKHKSLNNTRPIPLNIAIRGYMTGGGIPSCAAEDTQPGSEKVFGRNFAGYVNLSFKKTPQVDCVDNIRYVPGITCACCGVEVYSYETVSRIEDQQLFFFMPEAVKMLIKTQLFNPQKANRHEQEAFQFLNELAKKYPDKSFKNVMDLGSVQEEIQKELSPETRAQIKYYRHSLKRLCRNSKEMVEIMEPYEHHFSGVYKDVFALLKKYSEKYPNKDFNYILNVPNVYCRHLKKLQQKQREVVSNIERFTKQNYPEYQKILKHKTKAAKNIIFDEDTKIPQKRQRILDNYETLRSQTSPEYMQALMKIAQKLPKSSNSLSAFIAKYSYRSSEEIAHLILISGASSEEHIKPQNRDKNDKGPDIDANKIVMCAACNSQRSKTSYKDWLFVHPEMVQNCQKYIDKIIDAIISGTLINYNTYPQKVKESLLKESGGKIDLNIDNYESYYENQFNNR